MPAFKDSNGREWLVKLDAPTIKEVRNQLDFDLLADNAYGKLAEDDVLLVDTLWLICRGQANGLTDVEFGRALATGEAIESAAEALIQARRDFFRPGKRSLLRSLEDQQAAIRKRGFARAEAKLTDPTLVDRMLATAESEMDKVLASWPATPATSSPATVESVPPA